MPRTVRAALVLSIAALAGAVALGARTPQAGGTAYVGTLDEHPQIRYAWRPTDDRATRLNAALASGGTRLEFDQKSGYLRSVLEALGVSAESQLLVFSKTGIQRTTTSPLTPRSLYFDASVVVGFIPGAPLLEIAAHDREQGVVFYTIDQNPDITPTLTRRTLCLSCHVSGGTLDVPGMINRSVFTRADGSTIPQLGFHDVDHRTRLLDRWGGMYVTGNYTQFPYNVAVHAGNLTVPGPDAGPGTASNEVFIAWTASAPEKRGYPSVESDIASMLVFDHQARAINLLTRLNWEHRTGGNWQPLARELAEYLLFAGEAPPPARITPRAGFADAFARWAPRDRHGRSCADLELEHRLLKYPCSYMIYTEAFDHLPAPARQLVYARMWEILSGSETSSATTHLSDVDRRAVVEILRDTKKDLPPVFRPTTER